MPVYNGRHYIANSIRLVSNYMNKLGYPYEIIIVDDGSTDGTHLVAKKHLNDHMRIIRYEKNRGKGFAFTIGALKATGDITILLDSDLDVPPHQIKNLVDTIQKTNADIVITNKWHPQSKTIATPTRRFLSLSYNALVRLLTGLKLQDTQTGAKAFKTKKLQKIIKHLYVKRYAFDVELLLVAQNLKYKIDQIPSSKPIKLTTKFKTKEIIRMLLELLSITYRHKILRKYRY